MSHHIVDRRLNSKGKSTVNRRKFLKRVKDQLKEAAKKQIVEGNTKDLTDTKDRKIGIPGKNLGEPNFQHDRHGGIQDRVLPGNKKFIEGDRVPRPEEGDGKGGGAGSPDGEGEDGFQFNLTREEFLEIFFDDMELPNLTKQQIVKVNEYQRNRSGYTTEGDPSRINIMRTMRTAKSRRISLLGPKKKKLEELFRLIEEIENDDSVLETDKKVKIVEITSQIEEIKKKAKRIPYIDDIDTRYNNYAMIPKPTTQAVMFGIMDVSGSMGEEDKEIAKRFFMLLYLFLTKNYERVDIVWIRHHSYPKEVDEDEFFNSQETGGTVVSSALHMANQIIQERYPKNLWNIYMSQVTDGDNWPTDNVDALRELGNLLLLAQYFTYIEVDQGGGRDSDLWPIYESLKAANSNLEMASISNKNDVYSVLHKLFKKK
jgi:uncharacterized sporulation protein YeaH/YhbH (DUF444 family)